MAGSTLASPTASPIAEGIVLVERGSPAGEVWRRFRRHKLAVASAVIENRDLTTERAEEHIERQAREFERLKPYLLDRWNAAP